MMRRFKMKSVVARKTASAVFVGAVLFITTIANSDFSTWVRSQIERPVEFLIREQVLRASPRLDPRIKILVYDDQLVGYLRRPQLTAREWAALIRSINKTSPKSIIVDQIFAFDSAVPGTDAELRDFADAIREAGNVYTGAMVTPFATPGRSAVVSTKLRRSSDTTEPSDSFNAYGPTPLIMDAVAGIGHITYRGDGLVDLRQRVRSSYEIDHLMLAGLPEKTMFPNQIPIDYVSREEFTTSARSLLPFVKIAMANQSPKSISEDDVVVIAMNYFTAGTDVDQSPIGRIYRPHAWVSVLNSLLREDLIVEFLFPVTATILAICIGAVAGASLSGVWFWVAIALVTSTIAFAGILALSFLSIGMSWAFPAFAAFSSSVIAYAVRTRVAEQKIDILKKTLKGTVPEKQLDKYLENPNLVTMDSNEQILTLMFVDIAGFSNIADQSSPKAMFERLQEILGMLTKIVHKHGGSVDKTLGDGLLCFFGYALDGKAAFANQADAAINCAIEMQREILVWNLRNIATQKPVFPVRIGINTANVFVGYLGNEDRYDFTMIGSGVNFAQRLESACEPMSILMSGTTLDFSSDYSKNSQRIKTKKFKIKHHSELFSAVEFDPLSEQGEEKAVVSEIFRKQQNLDRKEQRWPCGNPDLVSIVTPHGVAQLLDFSSSGGCMTLPTYLARGVQLEIRLASQGVLEKALGDNGIGDILVEICWSRPIDGGFAHGFRFLNLNKQQNHLIFQSLREILPAQRYKLAQLKIS